MSATETTAAMTSPAEPDSSIPPDTGAQSAAASSAPASVPEPTRGREAARRTVSPNVVISVLGGFIAALLTALCALMVVQFNSLGNRIDNLGTELRAEIQAGFREVRSCSTTLTASPVSKPPRAARRDPSRVP